MIKGQSYAVSMVPLSHLHRKLRLHRGKVVFWGFSTIAFYMKFPPLIEISSFIGTPRGLVLVYVVPKPIICKTVSQISNGMYRTDFTPN